MRAGLDAVPFGDPLPQRPVAPAGAVGEDGRAVALDRGARAVGELLDREALRRGHAAGERDRRPSAECTRATGAVRSLGTAWHRTTSAGLCGASAAAPAGLLGEIETVDRSNGPTTSTNLATGGARPGRASRRSRRASRRTLGRGGAQGVRERRTSCTPTGPLGSPGTTAEQTSSNRLTTRPRTSRIRGAIEADRRARRARLARQRGVFGVAWATHRHGDRRSSGTRRATAGCSRGSGASTGRARATALQSSPALGAARR